MLVIAIKTEKKKFYKSEYFKNLVGWCISFAASLGITIGLFPYCIWNLHKDKGWTALTSVSNNSQSKFGNILWGFKCLSKSFFSSIPTILGIVIIVAAFTFSIIISIKLHNKKQLQSLSLVIVIALLYLLSALPF